MENLTLTHKRHNIKSIANIQTDNQINMAIKDTTTCSNINYDYVAYTATLDSYYSCSPGERLLINRLSNLGFLYTQLQTFVTNFSISTTLPEKTYQDGSVHIDMERHVNDWTLYYSGRNNYKVDNSQLAPSLYTDIIAKCVSRILQKYQDSVNI